MKRVMRSEWKHLYPIKKILFILLEGFFIVTFIRGFFVQSKMQDSGGFPYLLWFAMLAISLILLKSVLNYILVPYGCVPILSGKIPKKELTESIEREVFTSVDKLQGTSLYKSFLVSENWLCLRDYYIPRNGIVAMWLQKELRGRGGSANEHYHLWVLLITGDCFHRELAVASSGGGFQIRETVEQLLEEYTKAVRIEPKYGNKNEFLKYGSVVKEALQTFETPNSVLELVTKESEIQIQLIDVIKKEQNKTT